MNNLVLPPSNMWPQDGRFGAGPSKVRAQQIEDLAAASEWGTSHRKAPVMNVVKDIQAGLRELFAIPDGYEIVLGNGGATAFWAVSAVSLIKDWASFAVFGEFGSKFAQDAANAPWLNVTVEEAPPGELATISHSYGGGWGEGPDAYCYPENETSTGVASPVYRVPSESALTLVDATSIAGASTADLNLVDAYYFSPQKCFGADGGLWVAFLSPRAVERARSLKSLRGRPHFGFLDLDAAITASRKGQTVNTPAIGTLLLLQSQIRWMLSGGGLTAMAERSRAGANLIGAWAERSDFASPFVTNPAWRSPVVTTVDLVSEVPVDALAANLRQIGIVDVEGYRGLGRNQLRIASFPSIETADIEAALACIDWMVQGN